MNCIDIDNIKGRDQLHDIAPHSSRQFLKPEVHNTGTECRASHPVITASSTGVI